MDEEDLACMVSPEQLRTRLLEVESAIAQRHNIRGSIRVELLRRSRQGKLAEDELVSEWHSLFCIHKARNRLDGPTEPMLPIRDAEMGAASAAPSFFVS